MDAKEDDPDIDNPGFASFGAATFGHALAPTLDNDGDDVDHGDGTGDGTGNGTGNGTGDGNDRATDVRNPAHSIDNDFFYIKDNALYPKTGVGTLTDLKRLAVGTYNISLLQELFEEPEGQTMTSLLSGFSAPPARGSRLLAAIIAALHETRSSAIFYFLKNIVVDLSDRPFSLRLEISNMFVENLLSFITEKPEELQSAIALIRDTIRGIPTADEAVRSSVRSSKRSSKETTRFADDDDEDDQGPKSQHVGILTEAYKRSPLTELAERAQHMVNDKSVFMNVAHIVESNDAKLDGALAIVNATTDDFLGDFSSQFVVATKLTVMNGGARKSLQEINSKVFPDARKDAFIKSMCDNGMGQTQTTTALRELESIVYSIGGSPLEDGGIAAYGEQIGFSTEYNEWNLAPHIINLSVSGNQAFRHRRSSMNSSTSGSGGEASRKAQLLTSLAILATFSEKGPGGKMALTPTVEMQTLVKLMTAASLKMLQLFMDVIEDCCDPKSKYYKMVTKSVHMDHSDLSMWIDSMRKIKFREFDTPEELSEYEKSPACGVPPNTELDPNNVMAVIIDTQVFSWQSFKSAQLLKASSNTSILATMENVIRLGFEIVHPDKRLTIWHFLHLLDHFLRQVRELPWGDVPFLQQRYGIALATDNGKLVPNNLTENQIYLSGMYNVSLVSSTFGNDVNEAFGTTAFQTLVNSGADAAAIRRKIEEIRRSPSALNGADRNRASEESSRVALRELSDAVVKVVNSAVGTDRTSTGNVSGSRMVTQLGAFGVFEHKGHDSDKSNSSRGGGKSGGSNIVDKEKSNRGWSTIWNQIKKLDGTPETANSVCMNVNNALRSCSDLVSVFPTMPTVYVVNPNQLGVKGSLSVSSEEYNKIQNLKPFSQGVRSAVLDLCRTNLNKVSVVGRAYISDMKERNADLSKSTVAQHMKSDGTLDSKGKRILSDFGRKFKLAGAAAQVDQDDAAEGPVKKGNPKKGNKTKLDEDDEDVKQYRSWQADQAERAAEETRAAAAADEDRKLRRLAKFQAKETAKAFTKAFNQGGSPPDQDSDSEEDAGSPGRK